ncbi:MAG: peptidase [Oscillospiraceae bacterium]|nr:peptidase [Oscillospiraceae bacterium]
MSKAFFKETRAWLEELGYPGGDIYDENFVSDKTFPDGGQYRFEVPGIQGPKVMKTLLEELDRLGLYIHRVTQTKGIMFLTDDEISQMVEYAKQWEVDLILAIGPRATTDTSASVKTEEGMRMGYRLRGQDQVVRAIEEVKRGVRLGVRGFLVYDEGALDVLNQLRAAGKLPADVHFKMSAHSGHGNTCSGKLIEKLGADSFNPVRDIQIQMMAALRAGLDIPLDWHTENPKSSGGFIRHYEVPEMVRVGAPMYLKTGGSVAANHSWDSTEADAKKRAKQIALVKRIMDEQYPEAKLSPKGSIKLK